MVDTGLYERMISCIPEIFEAGDTYLWYFRSNSDESMDQQLTMEGSNKYVISDDSRTLIVINVSFTDEGLYYCKLMRNDNIQPQRLPGACLRVYSK